MKQEGMKGGKATKGETDVKGNVDYEAEEKASSSEKEFGPPEPTVFASEPDIIPVVHTTVRCDGCEVILSLTSGYF